MDEKIRNLVEEAYTEALMILNGESSDIEAVIGILGYILDDCNEY